MAMLSVVKTISTDDVFVIFNLNNLVIDSFPVVITKPLP